MGARCAQATAHTRCRKTTIYRRLGPDWRPSGNSPSASVGPKIMTTEQLRIQEGLPFKIPQFSLRKGDEASVYNFWGWHPRYPYWSKSCWGGATAQEARDKLAKIGYNPFATYAVALVAESNNGYTVIEMNEPEQKDVWWKFYESRNEPGWELLPGVELNEEAIVGRLPQ